MQPLWKTVWQFLQKLKTELPYDPAVPLWGVCVCVVCVSKRTEGRIALFTTARMEKQPKCPLTDESISKMWQRYTVKFYLIKEGNLRMLHMDEP